MYNLDTLLGCTVDASRCLTGLDPQLHRRLALNLDKLIPTSLSHVSHVHIEYLLQWPLTAHLYCKLKVVLGTSKVDANNVEQHAVSTLLTPLDLISPACA
jgi:hypothetical protein